MRVVFLDIDGVLNSQAFFTANGPIDREADMLDPQAISVLNTVLEVSQAVVVVSSTWRLFYPLPCIHDMLVLKGFKGTIVGATWQLDGSREQGERGYEIQAWLDAVPAVTSFAILDDDSDMAHLQSHLIKTNVEMGLTSEHINPTLKLLLSPE